MELKWIPDFRENFEIQQHEKYLRMVLTMITETSCTKYDPHKMLFLYCCIGGLRAINSDMGKDNQCSKIAKFLEESLIEQDEISYFTTSPYLRYKIIGLHSDIITTYIGVCCMIMANMSNYIEQKRERILKFINQAFLCRMTKLTIREIFAYCASKKLLREDFSLAERQFIETYIAEHETYDGGFALEPDCESHAAAAFCSVACLKIIGSFQKIDRRRLSYWVLNRQTEFGFSVI
jgi:prenyltransferase beta subunit